MCLSILSSCLILILDRDFDLWPHGPIWKQHFDPSLLLLPAPSLVDFSFKMISPASFQSSFSTSTPTQPPFSIAPASQFTTSTAGIATSMEVITVPFDSEALDHQANPTDVNQTEDWTTQQIKLAQKAIGPTTLTQLKSKVCFITYLLAEVDTYMRIADSDV